MYYTYILKSTKNGFIYVGSTEDVQKRILVHNSGRVKSTKAYRPWILLETIEFKSRSMAFKHEMFLKERRQKEVLRNKYKT